MHVYVAYIVDNRVQKMCVSRTLAARMCVCVCVCVWEGGRERGRGREGAFSVQQESIAMRDPKLAPLLGLGRSFGQGNSSVRPSSRLVVFQADRF